jgi:hypothetical protein
MDTLGRDGAWPLHPRSKPVRTRQALTRRVTPDFRSGRSLALLGALGAGVGARRSALSLTSLFMPKAYAATAPLRSAVMGA